MTHNKKGYTGLDQTIEWLPSNEEGRDGEVSYILQLIKCRQVKIEYGNGLARPGQIGNIGPILNCLLIFFAVDAKYMKYVHMWSTSSNKSDRIYVFFKL